MDLVVVVRTHFVGLRSLGIGDSVLRIENWDYMVLVTFFFSATTSYGGYRCNLFSCITGWDSMSSRLILVDRSD